MESKLFLSLLHCILYPFTLFDVRGVNSLFTGREEGLWHSHMSRLINPSVLVEKIVEDVMGGWWCWTEAKEVHVDARAFLRSLG